MIRLTVEETNLLSIYNEGGKRGLMENINAALPFMDEDMRELAKRTLAKIAPLTENEYTELAIFAADEDRKSTRLNSSHNVASRMPSSA